MTTLTGLYVTPTTPTDERRIKQILSGDSDFYAEWDNEGYFFFPESPSAYDALELDLQDLFNACHIQARFESI
jgi:hypothetical protein